VSGEFYPYLLIVLSAGLNGTVGFHEFG